MTSWLKTLRQERKKAREARAQRDAGSDRANQSDEGAPETEADNQSAGGGSQRRHPRRI